jgi:hypothetical protein
MTSLSLREQAWLKYPQDIPLAYDSYADFLDQTEDNRLFVGEAEDGYLGYLDSESLTLSGIFPTFHVYRTKAGQQAYEALNK